MAGVIPAQLAADIDLLIRASKQKYIKRNVDIEDIPIEDLDVLCTYFPIQLLVEMFGGHYQVLLKAFTGRMKEKEAAEHLKRAAERDSQEENFEPEHPAGIGHWKYAERLKQKVFRSLEGVLNQGVGTAGHSQFVQAAKALLVEAEKTKDDAAEVMMAYESQLIILAEHFVETFLPKLGSILKIEMRKSRDDVIKNITEFAKPDKHSLGIWKNEIGRITRTLDLKRFELLLAETMAKNQQVSEAFDFSKDLLDNYRQRSEITIESKQTVTLKAHIGKRG